MFVGHIFSPVIPRGEALVVIPCCNMPMAMQTALGTRSVQACILLCFVLSSTLILELKNDIMTKSSS